MSIRRRKAQSDLTVAHEGVARIRHARAQTRWIALSSVWRTRGGHFLGSPSSSGAVPPDRRSDDHEDDDDDAFEQELGAVDIENHGSSCTFLLANAAVPLGPKLLWPWGGCTRPLRILRLIGRHIKRATFANRIRARAARAAAREAKNGAVPHEEIYARARRARRKD